MRSKLTYDLTTTNNMSKRTFRYPASVSVRRLLPLGHAGSRKIALVFVVRFD
jgi:hypothetical protein